MESYIQKANILLEALPYIKEFHNSIIVVKIGGEPMINEDLKNFIALDLVLFKYVGIKTIVVHGGGKQITEVMHKLGKKAVFIDGLRVTDKETMNITEMVLTGMINKDLVGNIMKHGGNAVGISGRDGKLIIAEKISSKKNYDYGYVGRVKEINPKLIFSLIENDFIPIVSPIGIGKDGDAYNINADTVAGELASKIGAEKIIILTDVKGIYKNPENENSFLSSISISQVNSFIKKKIIKGGMLPKIRACVYALKNGVKKAHIIDGRVPHSLLLEVFTEAGIGTEIVA